MALPGNADVIVVHGYWVDELTGKGVKQDNGRPATVMFDPVPLLGGSATKTPNLRDIATSTHLKTRSRVATVNLATGYFATLLVASNDPDLDAYGGRKVTLLGEEPFVIEVPYNALSTTVGAAMASATGLTEGSSVRAIWLTDATIVGTPPPQPPTSYLTSVQTLSTIAEAVETHDADTSAHPDIRAAVQNATIPDATTGTKGKAKILGGTADAPTVPYSALTGAPSTLPPSGGAGGVLSGTYPNPGFAVDMATQAELNAVAAAVPGQAQSTVDAAMVNTPTRTELDAVIAAVPEQARDAVGAALVAGVGITITVNDASDTITISSTSGSGGSGGLTIEDTQDVMAALLAAGTQSGITFTYDDAGNALSATVQYGTTSTTAARGDDSRILGAMQKSANLSDVASAATSRANLGLGNVDNTSDVNKPVSTAQQTALNAKPPATRTLTAGTGLTGGGDLSADRSFAVAYGTTGSTAAAGDDSRLSDTRTPTDGSVTNAKVSASAAIAETKLNLASDAAAATASRRTLGTGATQAAAGDHTHGTGGALAELNTSKLQMSKLEYVSLAASTEVTLLNTTGPGVVSSIWFAVGGNTALDGRLRVYYDGASTATIDIDFGTLFAHHWLGGGSAGAAMFTPHMNVDVKQPSSPATTLAALITLPIPYGTSIKITAYNAASTTTNWFSMVTYRSTTTDTAAGKRLRCVGVRYADGALTRTAGATNTLASITGGPGSLVWHSYLGGVNATNYTWMERNFVISVDGEATPSITSSGTEDWFDSGWYFEGMANRNLSTHSWVMADTPGTNYIVGMATDLLSKWGGIPFNSSCTVTAATEGVVTTGDTFVYAILYYQ